MNSKHVTLGVILVLVIGLGGAMVNKFQSDTKAPSLTPTPTPAQLDLSLTKSSAISPTQVNVTQPKPKTYSHFPGTYPPEQLANVAVRLATSKGEIDFLIDPEATKAASNFIYLSLDGFYNNLIFHRVEDWVIQGGDPTGTGTGGPGYQFEDEPVTKPYVKGVVAMANSGPNTNGSQFFILKKDTPLPPNYTIFGMVTKGIEVVDKIQKGDLIQKVEISSNK